MPSADEHARAEDRGDADGAQSRINRLRRWLREADPARLWLLGLLAVPSLFVDSLAFLQLFWFFFLFGLWAFLEPVVDLVLERGAEDSTEPTDWIHMGNWRERVVAYLVLLPTSFLNPLVLVQDSFQLLGSAVGYLRYRGSVPDASDGNAVDYRLPLEGTWTVVNGSLTQEHSHSWFPLTQRYAYDFVVTDEDGRTRPGGATTAVENYYCYEEPVLAPADGVVVDVCDSDFEFSRGGGLAHPLKRDIRGNYVTIRHAPGEYSTLAHLVPRSVTVEPGERVERGQQIAQCGHSGNSSEPHLHFQFQDSPTFETATGLPIRFHDIETEHPTAERISVDGRLPGLPDDPVDEGTHYGDEGVAITAGQRVTTVEDTESVIRPTDGTREASESETADHHSHAKDNRPTGLTFASTTTLLQRTAYGVSLGALLAGVGGVVLSQSELPFLLAALAGLGLLFWVGQRFTGSVPRPGGSGAAFGVGLVATALWGSPGSISLWGVFFSGFLAYVAVAELERTVMARSLKRTRSPVD